MAHFAKINEKNIVEQVIVADTKEWCESVLGGEWIQTSYNTKGGVHTQGGIPFRKNYAGIGYTYDRERDAFIPPQPYPLWVLNEETCLWDHLSLTHRMRAGIFGTKKNYYRKLWLIEKNYQ